ncbi:unnamed protein product [Closterium sp. NIES-54]
MLVTRIHCFSLALLESMAPYFGPRATVHPVSDNTHRRVISCQAQSAISATSDLDSSPSEATTVTTKALFVVALVGVAAVAAGVRANWRFLSSEWFLTILAKLIGYIIVTASTVLKLPQIIRIVRSNSIEGLSVPSFEMECVGYTVSLLFCWTRRVPFSAYGELFFLVLQSLILMLLIYYHSPRLGRQRYLRAGIYMGVVAFLMSPAMRPNWFEALYPDSSLHSLETTADVAKLCVIQHGTAFAHHQCHERSRVCGPILHQHPRESAFQHGDSKLGWLHGSRGAARSDPRLQQAGTQSSAAGSSVRYQPSSLDRQHSTRPRFSCRISIRSGVMPSPVHVTLHAP